MRSLHRVALVVGLWSLACGGNPSEKPHLTPTPPDRPPPEAPKPPPPPTGSQKPPAERELVKPAAGTPGTGDTPSPGGWIQDEVMYDAQGNVEGCVGGGNWCASAPKLDPKTHKPRK